MNSLDARMVYLLVKWGVELLGLSKPVYKGFRKRSPAKRRVAGCFRYGIPRIDTGLILG
jgi:hypothetical protein